jgi:hypothetical protein
MDVHKKHFRFYVPYNIYPDMGDTKVIRIKPMEKFDNNLNYKIRIKAYICSSKLEMLRQV